MTPQTKVSGQFIQDTIPESTDIDCARCMLLEEDNQRLRWLIANMMQSVESIEEFEQ